MHVEVCGFVREIHVGLVNVERLLHGCLFSIEKLSLIYTYIFFKNGAMRELARKNKLHFNSHCFI